MSEKEKVNKQLSWLVSELSISIPWGRANFDPMGFISTNMVDIH
jgi:hypothetical protein